MYNSNNSSNSNNQQINRNFIKTSFNENYKSNLLGKIHLKTNTKIAYKVRLQIKT